MTDLILFEAKGTWPREAEFEPGSSETLLQSLRRQYGGAEEGAKGVAQLARVISAISNGRWLGPSGEFRKVRRIVPVLLVHDSLLGTPGFGAFAASEFDRLLDPDEHSTSGERLRGHVRVVAPVVMTVEDLEMLEVSVEHFSLLEALVEYSESCGDRMISLRDFLASSPKYSDRIYANRHLAATAMEPLKLAMKRLFSQSGE